MFQGSKVAVECIWNNQIRQNVQNLVHFRKKTWKFLKKSFCFLGITKESNFVVESDWNRKFSKNVQK